MEAQRDWINLQALANAMAMNRELNRDQKLMQQPINPQQIHPGNTPTFPPRLEVSMMSAPYPPPWPLPIDPRG